MMITMKKIVRIGALMLASAFVLAGCQDEIQTSELTLDLSKKATVQAYLYAELDLTHQGLEFVPNGTRVLISIPNSEFNPCLLYTSPSPRDRTRSRMPSSA